jgi:hypothetical protein
MPNFHCAECNYDLCDMCYALQVERVGERRE